MIKILKKENLDWLPWKNNGGLSAQISISPKDSNLENFNWRVSLARITQPGPFSIYKGYRRQLQLLSGNGLELDFSSRKKVLNEFDTVHFSGDLTVNAQLLNQEHSNLLDWGCIYLPHFQVEMNTLRIDKLKSVVSNAENIFIFAHDSLQITLHPEENQYILQKGDLLIAERKEKKELLFSFLNSKSTTCKLSCIEIKS